MVPAHSFKYAATLQELAQTQRLLMGLQQASMAANPRPTVAAPAARPTTPALRNVSFAACQDHEVAFETNGHGDFTQVALAVLKNGIGGMTNQEFQQRVISDLRVGREELPALRRGDQLYLTVHGDGFGDGCRHEGLTSTDRVAVAYRTLGITRRTEIPLPGPWAGRRSPRHGHRSHAATIRWWKETDGTIATDRLRHVATTEL